VKTRRLGADGPAVAEIGLGCMGMSGMYGPADRAEGIATIHAALAAGVDLLDTGDFYGMGHNELLIGEALRAPARGLQAERQVRRAARPRRRVAGLRREPARRQDRARALARAARRRVAATSPPTASSPQATSARTRRASPARTSRTTLSWWTRCARSPTAKARASRRSRSLGCSGVGRTSSRLSAHARARSWTRRLGRRRWSSVARMLPRSSRLFRLGLPRASGTRSTGWRLWIVSGGRASLPGWWRSG
jgi:hypothetical protein